MKNKDKPPKGAEGFDAYYARLYGDRWKTLREALFLPPRYIALPPCAAAETKNYFLDAASVCAALMLPVADRCRVLDMCAAPGGKSIIIASRLAALSGTSLVCNEVSGARRARLVSVLNAYVPPVFQNSVNVTGFDGAQWCRRETEVFDRILVDAPCSSERYVLQDAKHLSCWSPSRIKHLVHTQRALLCSAFRLLKHEGFMLYVTCSLSADENDGNVKTLLHKFNSGRIVFPEPPAVFKNIELPSYEKTEYGFYILPDIQGGAGPLYFSLIHKP